MLINQALRVRIEKILAKLEHCRDDDQRLLANVWQEEIIELKSRPMYTELKAVDLLGFIAAGKLSKPESVRRIRQKIQETQPLLRGQKYQERQRYEGEVRKEIRQYK